jgi:hypothetical protein
MIHRADCPYVQPRKRVKADPWQYRSPGPGVMPWHWADDQTENVIVAVIAGYGYLTCAHCKPVDKNKLASWAFLGYLKAVER